MSEENRTEKEMLNNIEDYTREAMKSSQRIASVMTAIAWIIGLSVVGIGLFILMQLGEADRASRLY